jgi:hypothetical protein
MHLNCANTFSVRLPGCLVDLGGSRGAAGRSCALPSKPEAGYLKDEIAFGVIRLVDVRTEAPPSFRSLFLEILQDLEKAKNTR